MANAMTEIDGTDQAGVQQAVGGSEPVLIRGIAAHWPVVVAARRGAEDVIAYLRGLGSNAEVEFSEAETAAGGRFHYSADLRGFNFSRASMGWAAFLDALAAQHGTPAPRTLAAQGLVAAQVCPRFEADNPMPLRPGAGEARLWIGTAAQVAAHSDPADNLAYCAAGQRRFTMFAPEQAANLYLGPFEPTPAGTPIAMTDPLKPDYDRYPRFSAAMEAALVADLEPGDAVYIPYGWFHHVEARSPVSMLVNYWWREPQHGGSAWDALLHGMMAIRSLSPNARRHWQAMFDAYVFETGGPAGDHLQPYARGVLDARSPRDLAAMRAALLRNLSRGS